MKPDIIRLTEGQLNGTIQQPDFSIQVLSYIFDRVFYYAREVQGSGPVFREHYFLCHGSRANGRTAHRTHDRQLYIRTDGLLR